MLYDELFDALDALDRGPINVSSNFPPFEMVEDKEGTVTITLALAGYTDDAIEIQPGENKIIVKTKDDYKTPKLPDGSKLLGSSTIKRSAFKATFVVSETKYNFAEITAKRNFGELVITVPPKEKKVYNPISITA
jgi:HSP20 family molecular chaperone IbpA